MKKITLKTVDGLYYCGELIHFNNDTIEVKNPKCLNGSATNNIINSDNKGYEYCGDVVFNQAQIIWYYTDDMQKN